MTSIIGGPLRRNKPPKAPGTVGDRPEDLKVLQSSLPSDEKSSVDGITSTAAATTATTAPAAALNQSNPHWADVAFNPFAHYLPSNHLLDLTDLHADGLCQLVGVRYSPTSTRTSRVGMDGGGGAGAGAGGGLESDPETAVFLTASAGMGSRRLYIWIMSLSTSWHLLDARH